MHLGIFRYQQHIIYSWHYSIELKWVITKRNPLFLAFNISLKKFNTSFQDLFFVLCYTPPRLQTLPAFVTFQQSSSSCAWQKFVLVSVVLNKIYCSTAHLFLHVFPCMWCNNLPIKYIYHKVVTLVRFIHHGQKWLRKSYLLHVCVLGSCEAPVKSERQKTQWQSDCCFKI